METKSTYSAGAVIRLSNQFIFRPDAPWADLRDDVVEMLQQVEARFGASVGDREIVAIVADGPMVTVPIGNGRFEVHVQHWNVNDRRQTLFQLAHEMVHVLSQDAQVQPTYLEEGLATVFQQTFDSARYGLPALQVAGEYEVARQNVEQLLALDPEAVRKIRETESTISKVTSDQMRSVLPSCDRELAERLAKSFWH